MNVTRASPCNARLELVVLKNRGDVDGKNGRITGPRKTVLDP